MFGANSEAKKKATEEILRQTRAGSRVDVHKEEDDLWKLASERLCQQIKTDGKNLGKGILKVRERGRAAKRGARLIMLAIWSIFNDSDIALHALPPSLPPLPQVNSFINHRVDVGLMDLCGHALADCFKDSGTTLILTAQTSGVLPAQVKRRRGGEVDFSVFQARNNSTQLNSSMH